MLAFEQLEAEMEVISINELMSIFGGTGSAQDIINYMEANGMTSWSSSSTGDVVGFSNSSFSSGGYYGSGGGFWAPSGSSSGGYSSNGGNSSNGGGGFDGGSGEINIQIDSGGAYLIDGQTYYSSSGVPYRKVSFDKGQTWQAEAMNIEPIIPETTGVFGQYQNGGLFMRSLYVSDEDAYSFLDGVQGGFNDPSQIFGWLSLRGGTAGTISGVFSGLLGMASSNWASVETKYMNSTEKGGLIIHQSTISMSGGGYPGQQTTYSVEDIHGNRLATFAYPGMGF